MFLVFGWKLGEQLGGVHDLLRVCETEEQALAFTDRLLHTDPTWEFHITDDGLAVQYDHEFPLLPLPDVVRAAAN